MIVPARLAFAGVALVGFQQGALAVQIAGDAALADAVEVGVFRHDLLDAALFQIGQVQVFKDKRGQLFQRQFRLVEVYARFLPGLFAGSLPLLPAGARAR